MSQYSGNERRQNQRVTSIHMWYAYAKIHTHNWTASLSSLQVRQACSGFGAVLREELGVARLEGDEVRRRDVGLGGSVGH